MIEQLTRYTPEGKENTGCKPYVVSGDLMLVLQKWADAKGLALPNSAFFAELRSEFNAYMRILFPAYEFVSEDELKKGIITLVNKRVMPTITLDSVYFRPDYAAKLDITRYVDEGLDSKGLGRRPGSPSLLEQFRKLKEAGVREARLVDDVIFTGDQTERVVKVLLKCGIVVSSVCAGIAIQEGVEKLSGVGVKVDAVRTYDEVIDEVCERDFYPGVPYCGRTKDFELNLGIPYILPFGKPSTWASIPEECQEEFSRFCMLQTAKLFGAIEEVSGTRIAMSEIDRKFGRIRKQGLMPFTGALAQMIESGTEKFFTRP